MRAPRWLQILTLAAAACLLVVSASRTWREVLPFTGIELADPGTGITAVNVMPGSPADRAGLRSGDRILEVGGTRVGSLLAARDRLAASEPGRPLGLVGLRYGQLFSASVSVGAMIRWHFDRVLASIVGLFFLLGGVAVTFRPRSRSSSPVYALWCLAGALLLGVSWSARGAGVDWLLFWADRGARLFFPALWIHFVLTLGGLGRRSRRWLPAVYAPACALLLGEIHLVGFSGALRADDPLGAVDALQSRLELGWVGFGLLVGALLLVHRAMVRDGKLAPRAQARWMVTGTILGLLPFLALTWAPRMAGAGEPAWSWASLPFLLLVPAIFTGAVLEYRLMDLALFGRRAVSGALLAGMTVVLFLGLLKVTGWLVPLLMQPAGIVPMLVAAVVTAALTPAVRAGVREIVGRLFYRRRYSFRRALERVARELNAEPDLPRLADVLERRIGEALDASPVRLLLLEEGERPLDPVTRRPVAATLSPELRRRLDDGESLALADIPSAPTLLPSLHLAGIQLLVPLRVETHAIALLAVGPRRHGGGLLDSDDLDLLRSVAAHAAAAVAGALNLSRLKEQVQLVRRLQSRTETLVSSSPISIVMIDQEGVVRHWNPAAASLFGVSGEQAQERSYVDVLPRELQDIVRRTLYAARQPERHFRVRLKGRDDAEILVNLTCSPLGGEAAIDGLLLTIDDVTDQARMEEQLIQQDRLASVGMLAAGVAHEVNTPLTGISSFAQILIDETPEDDPRRPLLEKVVSQADRASKIARGLLSISRPGGGDGLATGPVDLIELAEETLGLIGPQIRQARARVSCERDEQQVIALGDRSRLQQVVMNLLLNALDAIEPGGEIAIRGWLGRDRMCRLEIADDGVGILEEHRDRIFDPFFTTKSGGQGTGLGLSISYAIIREHAGTLVADSRPGRGTAMRILLPAAAEAARGRRAG